MEFSTRSIIPSSNVISNSYGSDEFDNDPADMQAWDDLLAQGVPWAFPWTSPPGTMAISLARWASLLSAFPPIRPTRLQWAVSASS